MNKHSFQFKRYDNLLFFLKKKIVLWMNRGDVCISILVSVVLIPPWQDNVLRLLTAAMWLDHTASGAQYPMAFSFFFQFFVGDFSVSNTCAPGSHNITHSYCFKTPGKSYAFCMCFFKMCVDQSLTLVLFVVLWAAAYKWRGSFLNVLLLLLAFLRTRVDL